MNKILIDGSGNITSGGNLTINTLMDDGQSLISHFFEAADNRFRQEIAANGKIIRIDKEVSFSSEALFSSLMQIGLPADAALNIPFKIVSFLKEMVEEDESTGSVRTISTADIRVAVVNAMQSLAKTGNVSDERVAIWSAAYIRRYGNPANEFVKIIDNGIERNLNYEYIEKILLPHVIGRILGMPKTQSPLDTFKHVFSTSRIDEMSKEIICAANTLNVYAVRYKTILHLLQDIILEPPHPWIVSQTTIGKVVAYNLERSNFHYERTKSDTVKRSTALLTQAYYEFFRHICAAILSKYGAFLGVGDCYGLLELKRLIKMKITNYPLWSYCRLHEIEADLAKNGMTLDVFHNNLDRIWSYFQLQLHDDKHYKGLEEHADMLYLLADAICQ